MTASSSAIALPIEDERAGALDPQATVLNSPAAASKLRALFRRVIDALIERFERRASQEAIRYLRTRKELSDEFRQELERRFMGQ